MPQNMLPAMFQIGPSELVFIAAALLTTVPALIVALSRNILYSAFSLFFTLLGTSGLYFFVNAEFLAVVQVVVYIGGVSVLLLFAILLTKNIEEIRKTNVLNLKRAAAGGILTMLIFAALAVSAFRADWREAPTAVSAGYPATTLKPLGELLMGRYLFPFEVAAVLLLVVLIGSLVIARRAVK